ncbi:MAG: hypothetical protein KAX57_12115 [Rhodoferax sp.]|nr:hypothetical protein [Rhodoferax sp.]
MSPAINEWLIRISFVVTGLIHILPLAGFQGCWITAWGALVSSMSGSNLTKRIDQVDFHIPPIRSCQLALQIQILPSSVMHECRSRIITAAGGHDRDSLFSVAITHQFTLANHPRVSC